MYVLLDMEGSSPKPYPMLRRLHLFLSFRFSVLP